MFSKHEWEVKSRFMKVKNFAKENKDGVRETKLDVAVYMNICSYCWIITQLKKYALPKPSFIPNLNM